MLGGGTITKGSVMASLNSFAMGGWAYTPYLLPVATSYLLARSIAPEATDKFVEKVPQNTGYYIGLGARYAWLGTYNSVYYTGYGAYWVTAKTVSGVKSIGGGIFKS